MKKTNIMLLIVGMLSILFLNNVSASSCNSVNSNKAKKLAYKIKADYEIENNSKNNKLAINGETTIYTIPSYIYKFTIYNINEPGIYLKIKNEKESFNELVGAGNAENGLYEFFDYDFTSIDTYTIDIIDDLPGCSGNIVRTIKIVKPKYNVFSEMDYCKSHEISICKKFIKNDLKINNEEDFLRKISLKQTTKEQKKEISLKEIVRKNMKLIIVVSAITLLLAIILIIVIFVRPWRKKI